MNYVLALVKKRIVKRIDDQAYFALALQSTEKKQRTADHSRHDEHGRRSA